VNDAPVSWQGHHAREKSPTNGSRDFSEDHVFCNEMAQGGYMHRNRRAMLFPLLLGLITFCGCQELVPRDTSSLLVPRLQRSELLGVVAGFGTTFAAVPDLVAMLRRRSSAGMNPRMAAIMGVFQILWAYYGLLIASRPVIAWNVIAVFINFLNVGAYFHFARKEKAKQQTPA
jgi:uncharacterized protein with PQ loop repeat